MLQQTWSNDAATSHFCFQTKTTMEYNLYILYLYSATSQQQSSSIVGKPTQPHINAVTWR